MSAFINQFHLFGLFQSDRLLDDAIDGFPAEWIDDGTLILCFPNVGVSESRVLDAVRKFLDS